MINPLTNDRLYIPDYKKEKYVGLPLKEWVLRYSAIQMMCADRVVLDVGSKYGFGALLLSQWAKKVVATDIKNRIMTEVDFVKADFLKDTIPFECEFDIVNCMEVIEHVDEPEKIIKNCAKACRDDGFLVLTTPCRDRFTDTHKKPYYVEKELIKLVEPYFEIILLKEHMNVSWFLIGKRKNENLQGCGGTAYG